MLKIETAEVTPFQQNARILSCSSTSKGVVVDPGGDVSLILRLLKRISVSCDEIWLTHSHLDHCGGVSELIESTGAKLVANPLEKELRRNVVNIARMYGLPSTGMRDCPEPDIQIQGGEMLSIGEHKFVVMFTPGHSPGHVVFYNAENGILIAGDTLFAGSIGRTDFPGADHRTLLESIRDKISVLPPETKVLPGHGPDTTVGNELRSNPFLKEIYK